MMEFDNNYIAMWEMNQFLYVTTLTSNSLVKEDKLTSTNHAP
jgi:hypothetical protein